MLTPEEFAVLIDGEGCINSEVMTCGEPYPRVWVGNTDPIYPKILHEQFGGCLRLEKKEGEQKDMWKWCVTGKACEKVLIFVLPVIRMKKLQAEAALLMASTIAEYRGSRRKLTTRDKLIRWRMHELLHQLNRRGKPAKEEVDEVVQELEE